MSIERWSCTDLDARMHAGDPADNAGQIALEMKPEREKVRYHDDASGPLPDQRRDGRIEIRRATPEERGLDQVKTAVAFHGFRDAAYGFVGGFDTRAVSKNDDGSRGHRGMLRVSQMFLLRKVPAAGFRKCRQTRKEQVTARRTAPPSRNGRPRMARL